MARASREHWLQCAHWRHDSAIQDGGDLLYLGHQPCELIGSDGLLAVAQGVVGIVMHFYHQAVGSDCDGCASERRNFVALPGSVTGIDQNGKMAQALHCGNNTQIERVTSVIGEGAYAALAEDDVVIA